MPLTYGSICSGIEAASVAWKPLGWRCAFVSEIEPFPCAVLAERHPDAPNLGSMLDIDGAAWRGKIDLLVGGTPCQSFSVAGKRGSLDDARGNLTLHFVELVHGSDPKFVVWENVPGVLSTKDNAFGCFLAGLVGSEEPLLPGVQSGSWPSAGMVAGPKRTAAWRVCDAQYFGLAQRRRRVFVVSCRTRDGINPGAVLFEPEGVRRDSAPSREAGTAVTQAITRRLGASGPDDNRAQANHLIAANNFGERDTATALSTKNQRLDADTETFIVHSLRADGFDASEDGTGRGTPIVPVLYSIMPMNSGKDYKAREVEVAQPLMTKPVGGDQGGDVVVQPVAYRTSGNCGVMAQGDKTAALTTSTDPNANIVAYQCHGSNVGPMGTMRTGTDTGGGVPFIFQTRCARNGRGMPDEVAPALTGATCGGHADTKPHVGGGGMAVRRLTPRECERLQGFPDDYTAITFRKKPASDGPRYKALGNSMAVPCMRWIGERIEKVIAAHAQAESEAA